MSGSAAMLVLTRRAGEPYIRSQIVHSAPTRDAAVTWCAEHYQLNASQIADLAVSDLTTKGDLLIGLRFVRGIGP